MADKGQPTVRERTPSYFTEVVEILVGSEQQRFLVHKEVITKRSTFFSAACSQRWSDLREGNAIKMGDADPGVFHLYLEYLYKGEVDFDFNCDCTDDAELETNMALKLVKVHFLCNEVVDSESADLAITDIIKVIYQMGKMPNSVAKLAFEDSAPEDPIQRLIVHFYSRVAVPPCLESMINNPETPASLVSAVLLNKSKIQFDPTESYMHEPQYLFDNTCQYHQHNDKAATESKKCNDEISPRYRYTFEAEVLERRGKKGLTEDWESARGESSVASRVDDHGSWGV